MESRLRCSVLMRQLNWTGTPCLASSRCRMNLQRSAAEDRELLLDTGKALAAAIVGMHPYTRGHSERVSRFSVATAQALGLPLDEIEKIRVSALLHDVGKIDIDDRVLKKPAAL